MFITAHSGAQKTKPNSREFLDAIRSGRIVCDVFEVDVRCCWDRIYLAHYPSFFFRQKVPLQEALSVAKEKNVKINLDIKEHGIFEKVQDLVMSLGMDEEIIYTGNVSPEDAKKLAAGVLYANVNPFCKGLRPVPEDAVELNCAAFLEGDKCVVGAVESPRSWHEFLTFEEKYEGGKYKTGGNRIVEGDLANRVRKVTESIYSAFELFGIVRVDYLYSSKEDVLYLNEINSQPGSLAYYLFEEIGISFSDLLARVIVESVHRFKAKDIIKFNSGVLQNLSVSLRK